MVLGVGQTVLVVPAQNEAGVNVEPLHFGPAH